MCNQIKDVLLDLREPPLEHLRGGMRTFKINILLWIIAKKIVSFSMGQKNDFGKY